MPRGSLSTPGASYRTQHIIQIFIVAPRVTWIRFLGVPKQGTYRSSSRPSWSWLSISRPPRRWDLTCLFIFSSALTRWLNEGRDVRYWPKADIGYCTAHVRFWG